MHQQIGVTPQGAGGPGVERQAQAKMGPGLAHQSRGFEAPAIGVHPRQVRRLLDLVRRGLGDVGDGDAQVAAEDGDGLPGHEHGVHDQGAARQPRQGPDDDLPVAHPQAHLRQLDARGVVGLTAATEALHQGPHAGEGRLVEEALGGLVAQALHPHPGALDADVDHLALGVATEAEGEGRRHLQQAQAQAGGDRRGQHVDHALRQILIGPPGAGLPVQVAVRGHQGRDIGDVDPEAIAVQAQGVVRVLVALVVDGEGREMGQVQAVLVRQLTHRQVGVELRQGLAGGMGIVLRGPMAELDQGAVGLLRGLLDPQGLEDAAVLRPPPGHALHLRQALGILGEGLAGRQAGQEGVPVPGRVLPRPPLGLVRLHLGPGPGADLLRGAAEPEPLRHQAPGRPGRGGGEIAMDELGQLPQPGGAALQQFPGLGEVPRVQGQLVQTAQGPRMEQVDVLEAHPLGLALVEGDLDLLPQAQDPGGVTFI